jgi:hypothetical protein
MNAQLPPLPESKKLTYYTGNTPFCYFSADQMHAYAIAALTAPKEAEPAWLTSLRNELPLTPMKSGFTLTRDELQYLVDRLAAPSKEATPSPQDRAPGEGEIAHIAYDFLLAAGSDMDSAPLTKIKEAALSSPTGEGAVEGGEVAAMDAIAAAFNTWPDDLRKKLSLHDLRRMTGWQPTARPQVQGGEALSELTREQERLGLYDPPQRAPGVDEAMVERALHARVPGGAEVWHWIDGGGFGPKEAQRNVMRAALEAALTRGPSGVDGETEEDEADEIQRRRLAAKNAAAPTPQGQGGRQ